MKRRSVTIQSDGVIPKSGEPEKASYGPRKGRSMILPRRNAEAKDHPVRFVRPKKKQKNACPDETLKPRTIRCEVCDPQEKAKNPVSTRRGSFPVEISFSVAKTTKAYEEWLPTPQKKFSGGVCTMCSPLLKCQLQVPIASPNCKSRSNRLLDYSHAAKRRSRKIPRNHLKNRRFWVEFTVSERCFDGPRVLYLSGEKTWLIPSLSLAPRAT